MNKIRFAFFTFLVGLGVYWVYQRSTREPSYEEILTVLQDAAEASRNRFARGGRIHSEMAAARVPDLATEFARRIEETDTSPILKEMIRLIVEDKGNEGVTNALNHYDSHPDNLIEIGNSNNSDQLASAQNLVVALYAADLHMIVGNYTQAESIHEAMLVIKPDWADVIKSAAAFYFDRSRLRLANGDLERGLYDGRRANDLTRQWITKCGATDKEKAELALQNILTHIGDILKTRSDSGDFDSAVTVYLDALKIAESRHLKAPANFELAKELSNLLIKIALFLNANDSEDCLRLLKENRSLWDRYPPTEDAKEMRRLALLHLGDFYLGSADRSSLETSIQYFVSAITLDGRTLIYDPARTSYVFQVSSIGPLNFWDPRDDLNPTNDVAGFQKRFKTVEYRSELVRAGEELIEDGKNADLQWQLAYLHEFLADALKARGRNDDFETAKKHFEQSLRMRREIWNGGAQNLQSIFEIWRTLCLLGDYHRLNPVTDELEYRLDSAKDEVESIRQAIESETSQRPDGILKNDLKFWETHVKTLNAAYTKSRSENNALALQYYEEALMIVQHWKITEYAVRMSIRLGALSPMALPSGPAESAIGEWASLVRLALIADELYGNRSTESIKWLSLIHI